MDLPPSMDDMKMALGELRNGKAAGAVLIPVDLLKPGGLLLQTVLSQLIQFIWTEEDVPADLKNALILPLYKGKGSKASPDNYRAISLLNSVDKLLARPC